MARICERRSSPAILAEPGTHASLEVVIGWLTFSRFFRSLLRNHRVPASKVSTYLPSVFYGVKRPQVSDLSVVSRPWSGRNSQISLVRVQRTTDIGLRTTGLTDKGSLSVRIPICADLSLVRFSQRNRASTGNYLLETTHYSDLPVGTSFAPVCVI